MDLVTDYKKIYVESTEKLLEYLRTVYTDFQEDRRDFYLEIDKYYRALLIWKDTFSLRSYNIERDKLLDNILHDYCSMVHNIAIVDIKVLYFLLRNIIESFVRYISNDLTTKDLEAAFSSVTANIVGDDKLQSFVRVYMSQLKQVYDEACLYIHADTTRMNKDMYTLLSFNSEQDIVKLEIIRKDFVMINIAMLSILKVKNVAVLEKMKENARWYLNFVIPLEERIREQKILYEY